ncbi:hypothetical protein OG588_16780 [Streptomyces prunicolor]|uniref:hypothetical protein n=1 Tax=Streptomyces prunicolor TaxID=67348 RepID=UPI003868F0B7|nr:hypothetical protein OG588_16780 [Streptomyces prunicolor]
MPHSFDGPSDYVEAAREMAATGRPTLARLLAEEAADRTPDTDRAARILDEFPGRTLRREV